MHVKEFKYIYLEELLHIYVGCSLVEASIAQMLLQKQHNMDSMAWKNHNGFLYLQWHHWEIRLLRCPSAQSTEIMATPHKLI
jgi:hypothetical protein